MNGDDRKNAVIVFVDLEHDRFRQYPAQWEKSLARRLEYKYRFEALTGDTCLIVRYPRISPALLRDLKARAVLVSGCATDFEHYAETDLAGLRAVYCEAAWPTLGLCGGFQLMAQSYGAAIGAMGGQPAPDAPNPFPESGYRAGMREEHGFSPVRVLEPHRLFDGLGERPVIYESHYWEVKSVPDGFTLLASSETCRLQAIAHERWPLFGTQFHPEVNDDEHPDGRRLIENFFRIAGVA